MEHMAAPPATTASAGAVDGSASGTSLAAPTGSMRASHSFSGVLKRVTVGLCAMSKKVCWWSAPPPICTRRSVRARVRRRNLQPCALFWSGYLDLASLRLSTLATSALTPSPFQSGLHADGPSTTG